MISLKLVEKFADQPNSDKIIYYSKTDLLSAFRAVPLRVADFWVLVMAADHLITGDRKYFCDKAVPFGAGSSCKIYTEFSNCLHHIVEYQMGRKWACCNYIDDFLFCIESEELCNWMVRQFLQICKTIGVPVALEKTEWAMPLITFLGILLNGKTYTLGVPQDKRNKAIGLIRWMINKKNATILNIQRLTGILNFLHRAIVPGRTFTRRMYDKLTWCDNKGNKLKQFHHIRLDREFIEDCKVWLNFLEEYSNSYSNLCHPFIDLNKTIEAETLNFYSDSLASEKLGMGTIFDNHWIVAAWGKDFILDNKPCIQFLELYALVAAIFTWKDRLRNMRIRVYCDNIGAKNAVNNSSSGCAKCMILLRLLVKNNLQYNRRIWVKYVKSKDNVLCDALSRFQFDRFWKNAPDTMMAFPDKISDEIWPPQKIWSIF